MVFRLLPRPLAAQTFKHLPLEAQESLLRALGDEQVAAILNDISPDDRTAFLEELPSEVTIRLLGLLSPGERAVDEVLLGDPENSIGRLMTPDYIAIHEDWTARQVFDYVREHGRDRRP